ncbi:hypothetical protein [Synechococcus sp. PCC 7336]|uniref:hypothetical protein n=1 Tax=Synechococcus sp. PCC 7336 TaxID=195250 RepID=UPI00034585B6|nr:hypothetical protein [Synechococcus sp. PCC 7336]
MVEQKTQFTKFNQTFWYCLIAIGSIAGLVALQKPQIVDKAQLVRDVEASATAQIATLEIGKYLGFRGLTASMLWLSFVQYFGDTARLQSGYSLTPVYLEAVASSEPRFEDVYFVTTSAIAIRSTQPERAKELIEFGLDHIHPDWNDRAYRLPFSLGLINFLYLTDTEAARQAYYQAADWYEVSNRDSAQSWREIGDRLNEKPESRYLQFHVWNQLLRRTQDPESRRSVLQRLAKLGEVRQLPDGSVELIPPPNDL